MNKTSFFFFFFYGSLLLYVYVRTRRKDTGEMVLCVCNVTDCCTYRRHHHHPPKEDMRNLINKIISSTKPFYTCNSLNFDLYLPFHYLDIHNTMGVCVQASSAIHKFFFWCLFSDKNRQWRWRLKLRAKNIKSKMIGIEKVFSTHNHRGGYDDDRSHTCVCFVYVNLVKHSKLFSLCVS